MCCRTFIHLLHSIMPRISAEKRSLVIEFTNGGMSQKEIAHTLNISRRSVQYIIKKFKETGQVADRERSGRPLILSKRMERLVVRISQGTPMWTARRVRQESKLTDVVSINTVKRTLRRHVFVWTGCSSKTLLILSPPQESFPVVSPENELVCGKV